MKDNIINSVISELYLTLFLVPCKDVKSVNIGDVVFRAVTLVYGVN